MKSLLAIFLTKYATEVFSHPRVFSLRGPIPWLRPKYDRRTLEKAIRTVVKQYESDKNGSMWRRSTFAAFEDHCKT